MPAFVSWVLGIVCWVLGIARRVLGIVFWVSGFVFWVSGIVFWVSGNVFRAAAEIEHARPIGPSGRLCLKLTWSVSRLSEIHTIVLWESCASSLP